MSLLRKWLDFYFLCFTVCSRTNVTLKSEKRQDPLNLGLFLPDQFARSHLNSKRCLWLDKLKRSPCFIWKNISKNQEVKSQITFKKCTFWSSHCGSAPNGIHIASVRIRIWSPSFAQWVKSPVLLWLWCRPQLQLQFDPEPRNFHMSQVQL